MEQQGNLFDLHLDQQSVNYLGEAARWGRLLSIVGFIICGLLALFGLFGGSLLTKIMTASMSGSDAVTPGFGSTFWSFYLISLALISFFPAYYLYNFSTKTRRAIQNNDQTILSESLKNLKSFFKFYGVVAIIMLSLYALALVSAIIGVMIGHRP